MRYNSATQLPFPGSHAAVLDTLEELFPSAEFFEKRPRIAEEAAYAPYLENNNLNQVQLMRYLQVREWLASCGAAGLVTRQEIFQLNLSLRACYLGFTKEVANVP